MELELTPQNHKRANDLITEAIKKKGNVMQIISLSKHRSNQQNRLQWLWLNQAAKERPGETVEEYRGYCKLHFGVPILRDENEAFRDLYDRIIRPHSYEEKLLMMQTPLDFPITRLMNSKQMTLYMDLLFQHFRELGVDLQEP